MKNKIASIQARLKAFSRENGQNHQLTLKEMPSGWRF